MAFNYPNYYGYPAQQYGQPLNPQVTQPLNQYSQPLTGINQINQDERIWVQGEGSAQAYLVAPNSFVRLWDSSQAVFYEKRADASGRPYMETFEYKRKGSAIPSEAVLPSDGGIDYGAKIKALEARLDALEGGKKDAE